MRTFVAAALGAALLTSTAWASPGPRRYAPVETSATIFAGGGTPLTNGIFFPGTAIADENGDFIGPPPVQVRRGTDFEFINLDEGAVGNGHKIISFKRFRYGRGKNRTTRPAFASDLLDSPGERSLVVTSHVKPGVYAYYCTVHAGMFGRIEIVGT